MALVIYRVNYLIMIKKYLENLYDSATRLNHQNIMDFLVVNPEAKFLDLGCDDGVLTLKMAQKIGTKSIFGVDIVDAQIAQAQDKGVTVMKFDLNERFSFEDNYFDAIHANQVIEHLWNSDNFISELRRILKPGGYAIISTENASSWCNIFASIMGWQIFSLTNFSSHGQGVGNPLALHRGDPTNLQSWNHVRIYNFFGLKEYFEKFGFLVERVGGAGYFPLGSFLGNWDKVHCHFMTFKIKKI